MERLDDDTARRVTAALARFAESGTGDVKKLKGVADRWRLRVGTYRVIFGPEPEQVLVRRILDRCDAYR